MTLITQERVDESLSNAVENDYEVFGWGSYELARDLSDYDSMYEGIHIDVLRPFVKNWLERNRPKDYVGPDYSKENE